MTIPVERRRAVLDTRDMLVDLMVDFNVSKELRDKAYRLLKHYPTDYDMMIAGEEAPSVFGYEDE